MITDRRIRFSRLVAAGIVLVGFSGAVAAQTFTSSRAALFVSASTSSNKTSVVRVINTTASSGTLTATAYDESGAVKGAAGASLGAISGYQAATFTSAQLESALGFTPSAGTAKYSVYFSSTLPAMEVINYTRDVATGAYTLSQSLAGDRVTNAVGASVTRTAWFVSSSTSASKTNVLRIINTSAQNGTLTATAYAEDGSVYGTASTGLGAINAHQMLTYTSAQIEAALGFTPPTPTSKYRVVFSANLPSLELVNFTRDNATLNLALVQAQLDGRASSSASSSTRNVLIVYPSNNAARTSVIRVVNPTGTSFTATAIVYDQSGTSVASGPLGTVGANQILALTSAQIETLLGYSPLSNNVYSMVITASAATFEVINDIKIPSTGNLYLAQPQTDGRTTGSASTTTRGAYVIYPSNNPASTTLLEFVNTTVQNATLTATAYSDSGAVVASNVALGTLGPHQILGLTSAQLEGLTRYVPPSSASTWRLRVDANVSNFELINYAQDTATGLLTLAQPQVDAGVASSAYSLDNCTTSIAADVPAFYRNYFRCVTITMTNGDVKIKTGSLPPYLTYYYGASSPNYTAFDTSGSRSNYHPNPNTLVGESVTLVIPSNPVSRGLTITSGMVDKVAGTSPYEYSGSPQGVALNGVQLFHGVAAPGDNIDQEAFTFDNYQGHPANPSYHHHTWSPDPLEVLMKLGYDTNSTPGAAEVELFGMMCDGTVFLGCTELDGSAASPTGLDPQNGHVHDIVGRDGTVHFTSRYHVHSCPSKWTTVGSRPYTPEIQYYNKCTVTKP